jgi:hypothetical protein
VDILNLTIRASMKKLPQRTKYFFYQFVNGANKQIIHPLDWIRFYRFIYAAHRGRTRLSEGELEKLLVEAGFPADNASQLANIYYHGRGPLKRKPYFNYDGKWKES